MKVGLCWSGLRRPYAHDPNFIDGRRSVTLAHFAKIADLPMTLYSLQLGDPASEPVPVGMQITPLNNVTDMLDTAALILNLDLVITVDTAVAHLAGSLGVRTWVLNRYGGCWRWMDHRSDTPWYPKMRLFRQPSPGEWDYVVFDIREALAEMIQNRKVQEQVLADYCR
jgi:hypothetical protein